jgi:hypothetical protein
VTYTCGDAGGRTKDGRECGQVRPTLSLCPWHDPNVTERMCDIGGRAAARAKLVPERIDLSTPDRQARVIERAVAGLLTGGQNVKAAAAVIDGVRVASRIYADAEFDRRLRALEGR